MVRTILPVVAVVSSACLRFPPQPVGDAPSGARRCLVGFATALRNWDLGGVQARLAGGGEHPRWRRLRSAMLARGIRFVAARAIEVRELRPDLAVGALRLRVEGGEADGRDKLSKVVLWRTGGEWKVTFWGTRAAAKAHLRWVLAGGHPLQDPTLRR